MREPTIEEVNVKLLRAIPHFRYAIEEAKKKGAVKLGILSQFADGGGKIEMIFECDEFFNDLAILVGAPPQTTEDNIAASALAFRQKWGIKSAGDDDGEANHEAQHGAG